MWGGRRVHVHYRVYSYTYFIFKMIVGVTTVACFSWCSVKANHVIHFDRWWNPAVENQATDRAFRIGQHRAVMVHKFVTKGSIEEKISEMIEAKQKLSGDILMNSGEQWITEYNNDDEHEPHQNEIYSSGICLYIHSY